MEYGWHAFNFIQSVLEFYDKSTHFFLEGAAYHKIFGQVGLADIRTGFYLGARSCLDLEHVHVVAPMAVRKAVFNDGKYQAANAFPLLPHNAADAVAIAAFGLGASLRTASVREEGNNPGVLD